MPQPLFSVILPTYNRARMAAAAVLSVLAQTDRDWELLLVDDGSTDESPEVFSRLPPDPRVSLTRMPKNRGQHAARNHAIAKARGRFITFLDSDDLYLPERLERFRAAIEARPSGGFWFSNAYQRRCGVIFDTLFDNNREIPEGKVPGWYAVGGEHLPYVTTNIAVARSAFEKHGSYREDLKILEDTELYARMLKGGVEVGVVRKALSVRNLHAGQITVDFRRDFVEALVALKAGDPPPEVYERKRRELAGEVATYLAKGLKPREARTLLSAELGEEARNHPAWKLAGLPRALLAAGKAARQAWLCARYCPALAPAEYARAAAAIRPFIEEAERL